MGRPENVAAQALMNRHGGVLSALNAACSAAMQAGNDLIRDWVAVAHDEWVAAGGCTTCRGHGVVLTWSTLDSSAYDEHGQCQACGGSGRVAAPDPVEDSARAHLAEDLLLGAGPACKLDPADPAYPSSGGRVSNWDQRLALARQVAPSATSDADLEAIRAAHRAAQEALVAERERQAVRRGKEVMVVKGRKVPVGTVGRVGWYGSGQYGDRVGLDLADGTRVWTSAENVAVLA